jgi:hypothetical protein
MYYVCAQPSPTWLVLPAAETAVLDLVRVASPCREYASWDFVSFTSQRLRTSSLLGYDNSFLAKSGLRDFCQETDDIDIVLQKMATKTGIKFDMLSTSEKLVIIKNVDAQLHATCT